MSNIIVNAPIQNRDFNPDQSFGKLIPVFVADWLRQQDDRHPFEAVDLWNNALASEGAGLSKEQYQEITTQRLDKKYTSDLLSVVRQGDHTKTQTDTDDDFTQWSQEIVAEQLSRGTIHERVVEVVVCDTCDATITTKDSPCDNGCMSCQSHAVHIETRPVLTSTIGEEAETQADQASGTTHTSSGSRLAILNRTRPAGISLENIGFPNEVLDPKVGLGLLAVFAALGQGANSVDIISSRQYVRHNLADYYAFMGQAALHLPAINMVGISKAPVMHIQHLQNEGLLGTDAFSRLMMQKLPPHLLSMRRDMSPQTLEQIVFSRK